MNMDIDLSRFRNFQEQNDLQDLVWKHGVMLLPEHVLFLLPPADDWYFNSKVMVNVRYPELSISPSNANWVERNETGKFRILEYKDFEFVCKRRLSKESNSVEQYWESYQTVNIWGNFKNSHEFWSKKQL